MGRFQLGEFEQRVLLAILRCDDEPPAAEVRRELERMLGRDVSRGAFYTTLERLEAKGRLTWRLRPRAGSNELPERCLEVTSDGMKDLRELRKAQLTMWGGLEPLFDKGRK